MSLSHTSSSSNLLEPDEDLARAQSTSAARPASARPRRSTQGHRWEDVLGQAQPSGSFKLGPQTLDLEGDTTRAALRARLMEVANPEVASPHARTPLERKSSPRFASGPFEVPTEEVKVEREQLSPVRLAVSVGLSLLLGLVLLTPPPQPQALPEMPVEQTLQPDQYGLLRLDAPLPFQVERALRQGDLVVIWVSTDWENLDVATRQRGLRLLRALLPENLDVQLMDTRAQLRGELYGNTYFLYP